MAQILSDTLDEADKVASLSRALRLLGIELPHDLEVSVAEGSVGLCGDE